MHKYDPNEKKKKKIKIKIYCQQKVLPIEQRKQYMYVPNELITKLLLSPTQDKTIHNSSKKFNFKWHTHRVFQHIDHTQY